MPWSEGMLPVSREARAGEQTGETQKKFSKRTPFAASLSSVGVLSSSFPAQPSAQAPWSSETDMTMFGCDCMEPLDWIGVVTVHDKIYA